MAPHCGMSAVAIALFVHEVAAPHLLNVARECELELPAGAVPDLDSTVSAARGKPLVAGVKGDAAHPPAAHRNHRY
jgi:hypothetical protein